MGKWKIHPSEGTFTKFQRESELGGVRAVRERRRRRQKQEWARASGWTSDLGSYPFQACTPRCLLTNPRIHSLWPQSSLRAAAWRKLQRTRGKEEYWQQVTITGHPQLPSKDAPRHWTSSHKRMCIFMSPLKLEREPTYPHPAFASRQRGLPHPHGNMKRKWNSVPRLVIFFPSFSWVDECQMFLQNVFISSGQPARIPFIIAQRSGGHTRFIRWLWSLFVSPTLRRYMWPESEVALLST